MKKLLEWLSRAIVRIFFREIIIEGAENLPDSAPVLFTPNHPNALLDPLLLQCFLQEFKVRFVAKKSLFKVPILGSILSSLGAIPVTRRMDVKNADVDYTQFFEVCVNALQNGESIAIFPEGRSLPQPFLAPLRTGPARLFFLAREKSIDVRIVPVGLNYESGSLFRSAVLISIAPPLDTRIHEAEQPKNLASAVRTLTDDIGRALDQRVFQAETYRDRELILLLERLYSTEDNRASSWADRLERLRIFESAIDTLRNTHSPQIDRIRYLLARYQRISTTFQIDRTSRSTSRRSGGLLLASTAGMVLAALGGVINIIPYKAIDFLVRRANKDESEAATFKIMWGLILFPFTYVLEALLVYRWLGLIPCLSFAVMVVPLTLFTMRFFEWNEEIGGLIAASSGLRTSRRVSANLQRLRERIISEVDLLATEREKLNHKT